MKILLTLLVAAPLFAYESKERNGFSQPCNSWAYNSTVNGYICGFLGSSFDSVERQDIDRLQNQINALTERVRRLEDKIRED